MDICVSQAGADDTVFADAAGGVMVVGGSVIIAGEDMAHSDRLHRDEG